LEIFARLAIGTERKNLLLAAGRHISKCSDASRSAAWRLQTLAVTRVGFAMCHFHRANSHDGETAALDTEYAGVFRRSSKAHERKRFVANIRNLNRSFRFTSGLRVPLLAALNCSKRIRQSILSLRYCSSHANEWWRQLGQAQVTTVTLIDKGVVQVVGATVAQIYQKTTNRSATHKTDEPLSRKRILQGY